MSMFQKMRFVILFDGVLSLGSIMTNVASVNVVRSRTSKFEYQGKFGTVRNITFV